MGNLCAAKLIKFANKLTAVVHVCGCVCVAASQLVTNKQLMCATKLAVTHLMVSVLSRNDVGAWHPGVAVAAAVRFALIHCAVRSGVCSLTFDASTMLHCDNWLLHSLAYLSSEASCTVACNKRKTYLIRLKLDFSTYIYYFFFLYRHGGLAFLWNWNHICIINMKCNDNANSHLMHCECASNGSKFPNSAARASVQHGDGCKGHCIDNNRVPVVE